MLADPGDTVRFRKLRSLYPAPLRYSDFRILWLATILTGIAFAGETVIMGWLLLEATDSPFIVGLGVGLRAIPN